MDYMDIAVPRKAVKFNHSLTPKYSHKAAHISPLRVGYGVSLVSSKYGLCPIGNDIWGKIIIPMHRLWLHSLYGLYGPRCPLSPKRLINLISLSSGWSFFPFGSQVDSFTVSLHCPNDWHSPTLRAVQGDCHIDLWKIVEIPTGHMSTECIASEAFPTYI